MGTNSPNINDVEMKTKTPKNNTFKQIFLKKLTHRKNLLKYVMNFNHMKIITASLYNKNNKLNRLVQPINNKKGKTEKKNLDFMLLHQ